MADRPVTEEALVEQENNTEIPYDKKKIIILAVNDFKVGYQIHTAKPLLDKKDMTHPVTFAYSLFQDCPRESWDLLTVWYAALEDESICKMSNEGTITIKDDAETIFDENQKSNHYYLRLNNSISLSNFSKSFSLTVFPKAITLFFL